MEEGLEKKIKHFGWVGATTTPLLMLGYFAIPPSISTTLPKDELAAGILLGATTVGALGGIIMGGISYCMEKAYTSLRGK